MAEALVPGQRKFASALSAYTGLDPRVVGAWVKSEQSGSAAQNYQRKRYFNWLNIARTDSGDASGSHSSVWSNPESAARATAEWIKGRGKIASAYGRPAPGIRAILNSAGRDPQAQINAIGNSGWATAPDYASKIASIFGSELKGDRGLLAEARRHGAHSLAAGQLAAQIMPHLSEPAGPSSAQTTDIVRMLQTALAPQQGASVAGTALSRPQTSGGSYQSPTAPRVPAALTPQPKAATQDTVLGLLAKLGQDASTTEVAGGQQPAPAGPLPVASPQAQGKLAGIVATANRIGNAHVPYLWGGGHAGKMLPGSKVTPLDCSGAVSAALGINPKVSGEFESWGAPGKGRNVTIWANAEHVLMEVNGRFWGTSHSNPGGGAGWIKPGVISKSYLRNFTPRHPGKL